MITVDLRKRNSVGSIDSVLEALRLRSGKIPQKYTDWVKEKNVEAQWTSTGEAIFTYEADALAFKLTFGL
jgi:hypothetical protein